MEKEQKLIELGEKVWGFRRKNGLTKKISSELQLEAARLCKSGVTAYSIGKALGVPQNTISDWVHRQRIGRTKAILVMGDEYSGVKLAAVRSS